MLASAAKGDSADAPVVVSRCLSGIDEVTPRKEEPCWGDVSRGTCPGGCVQRALGHGEQQPKVPTDVPPQEIKGAARQRTCSLPPREPTFQRQEFNVSSGGPSAHLEPITQGLDV